MRRVCLACWLLDRGSWCVCVCVCVCVRARACLSCVCMGGVALTQSAHTLSLTHRHTHLASVQGLSQGLSGCAYAMLALHRDDPEARAAGGGAWLARACAMAAFMESCLDNCLLCLYIYISYINIYTCMYIYMLCT